MDATVGAGGHARALLSAGPEIELLGLDRDPDALALGRAASRAFGDRVSSRPGELRRPGDRARRAFRLPTGSSRTSASRRCSSKRPNAASRSGATGLSTCACVDPAAVPPTSWRRLRSMNSLEFFVNTGRNGWRQRSRAASSKSGLGSRSSRLASSPASWRARRGDREKIDPGDPRLSGAAHRGQRGAAVGSRALPRRGGRRS